MNNVIQVNFSKKNIMPHSGPVRDTGSLDAYLNSLRNEGVEEDDILDVIDAINDVNVYFSSDDEVKTFADGWLQQFL
jgi:hypothetical protein